MAEFLTAAIATRLADAERRLSRLRLGDAFDPRAPQEIVASGLHLLTLPAASGGLGGRLSEAAYVQAALGAIDGSTALGFAMHLHVTGTLAEVGVWPDHIRARFVQAVRGEGALINAASTEENGGSPARGAVPETIAEKVGDCYRLTGEKTWTTWLPALRFALVTAGLVEVDREASAEAGRADAPAAEAGNAGAASAEAPRIGSFLVDLDLPGVSRQAGFDALGMRGSASGRLRLEGVEVPADHLLFVREPGKADPRGASPQVWFATCIAATYLGIGEGARQAVTRWAIDRRPGDRSSRVADLPTVQVRLGRMDAVLRSARIVLFDVARRWDAAQRPQRGLLLPDVMLAKVVATNAAATATEEALRIGGGPGFLAGRLERAFRDARAGLINPPLDDVAYQEFAKALIERAPRGG